MQCMVLFLNGMKPPFKHQLIRQKWINGNFRFEINTFIAQDCFIHRTSTFNMSMSTKGHCCLFKVPNFSRAQHFKKINKNTVGEIAIQRISIMKHWCLLQHWSAGIGLFLLCTLIKSFTHASLEWFINLLFMMSMNCFSSWWHWNFLLQIRCCCQCRIQEMESVVHNLNVLLLLLVLHIFSMQCMMSMNCFSSWRHWNFLLQIRCCCQCSNREMKLVVHSLNVLLLLLVLHIFSMQSGHSRLVGIVCKNPRCRKTFESLHAYNQHRRHPSNKGTQCSSLLCMGEIVVDTRRNVGTAILRREDSPAMQGTFDDYSCLFYENIPE